MILANLARAVREQNYYAVALEFLIVIAGVVIGFQISAWNTQASERAEAARLLEDLRADLLADVAELNQIRAEDELRTAAILTILDSADIPIRRQGHLIPDFPTALVFEPGDAYAYPQAVLTVTTMDGNRHTYNSLINTGEIRLIGDTDLARAIQTYYFEVDAFRDFEGTVMNHARDVGVSMRRNGIYTRGQTTRESMVTIVASDARLAAEMGDFLNSGLRHHVRAGALVEQAEALIERIGGAP